VTKQERADHVRKRLAELYPDPPIPLDHRDAYTLLVAVLLSAQCTDVRVNQITPHLFKLAKNPEGMAKVPVAEIEKIVKPCGLGPQKAKAISQLSKDLLEHHHGQVPRSLEELEKLPGVGHKTAQVVMAQAFGVPSFPVDTHIHRLAPWRVGTSCICRSSTLGGSIVRRVDVMGRAVSSAASCFLKGARR